MGGEMKRMTRRAFVAGAAAGAMAAGSRALALTPTARPLSSETLAAAEEAVEAAKDRLALPAILSSLTLEQKVGQLFMTRPEAVVGYGTCLEVTDEYRVPYMERPIGGVMLKDANFIDPDQTRRLNEGLQQCSMDACGLPMLIAVDEEGGTVVRVSDKAAFGVADPGNMRSVGEWGDVTYAESEAHRIGSYLRGFGVNVDFAPDADITDDPNSFVYWRSFGGDPSLVADMVGAMVRGFESAGALCTPKHFPGIGDAQGDSHIESIYLDKSLDELREHELKPFVAAIEAGTHMVMVSHMTCTALDASKPASLSPVVVNDVLRGELGFDGVVITDSLGMAAVHELYAQEELGVLALEAGCDLLLSP
ncbi:MAG: glycoside hydrolase family 3 protein, partial [Atopobiaceae bacterium]|nr:glycoside hydrolase family 3 protein [Atopobiaceae bacterium]